MLPKIDVPVYDLKLISQNKKIRYRPFTVKEEKLFLMANESKDEESVINTVKQVINNCVLDEIDVDSLPVFDLEYLFINLRAKSVGEEVKLNYQCNNNVEKDGKQDKCGNMVNFTLNLIDVKPESEKGHTNKIEINDKLGIVMRYPKLNFIVGKENKTETEIVLDLIIDCIDYIYDENQMYYAKDSTRQELVDFVDSLQSKDLEKIKTFFDTMPKVKKQLDFKCNKCGYEDRVTLEGIQNFFV
jgi:hypothetical protein